MKTCFKGNVITQSCPALCDPVDCSLPGSSVYGLLQTRILEWLLFPPPGDLPEPSTELGSLALQADSFPSRIQCLISK